MERIMQQSRYGSDVDSVEAWETMAASYVSRLEGDYHRHRLSVIRSLIPTELFAPERRVFDFGCGDAVLFEPFLRVGAHITGCDVSTEMITLARARLAGLGIGNADASVPGTHESPVAVGGADAMTGLPDASLDAILSFNVLAYLTDDEEATFYREARRALKPGGYLITTHSNELFDLFSLNSYTVGFFGRHFVSDPLHQERLAELLTNNGEMVTTYNVRENPLTYPAKLRSLGFEEVRQEFINRHDAPPALLGERQYPDTLAVSTDDRWKLMFTCSTYGSVARRLS